MPNNEFRNLSKPEPRSLEGELIGSILHPENYPRPEDPIETMLQERYPEVPSEERQTWFSSDDTAQTNNERATSTNNLVTLMEQAISACCQFRDQTEPMPPNCYPAIHAH